MFEDDLIWTIIKRVHKLLVKNKIYYFITIISLLILGILYYFHYININENVIKYINEVMDYKDCSTELIVKHHNNNVLHSFLNLFTGKIHYYPSYIRKDNFVMYDNSTRIENTACLDITNEVKYLLKLTENILENQRCTINNINTILNQ